jgi:hypothetical protein
MNGSKYITEAVGLRKQAVGERRTPDTRRTVRNATGVYK